MPSRIAAIGPLDGLPAPLQRALDPRAFEPLPKPGPMDWLASHPEPGQTFAQWMHSSAPHPDARRRVIYLQPLGTFGADAPPLAKLEQFAAAFFMMDVKVLSPVAIDAKITSRSSPMAGKRQLLTSDLLNILRRRLPPDAFCILGITMEDLYPAPSWNYVFGVASLEERVGVYSFARYGGGTKELMLRRSCKVLAHETSHMFGIAHCIWFRCVVNGSNHLAETDARPMHLCPVDLRKLQRAVGFDVVERYRRLHAFCAGAGFQDEAKWLEEQLSAISS